jgi:hypothetical protein
MRRAELRYGTLARETGSAQVDIVQQRSAFGTF